MDLHLQTPDVFPAFPYDPPYSIQTDLMRHLYESIEKRAVTIVESPTGTGKTLSLLTAALTWLEDEKNRARKGKMKEMLGDENKGDVKDWVIEQTRERIRRQLEVDELTYQERLLAARKREEVMRRAARARILKKPKWGDGNLRDSRCRQAVAEDEDDDRFLPDDDRDERNEDEIFISPALRALMNKVDKSSRGGLDDVEATTCTKIYYASRTHSQLSQILPELRRLKLSCVTTVRNFHPSQPQVSSIPRKRGVGDLEDGEDNEIGTRTVALGSRKQLCINEKLKSRTQDLDEACRELLGEKGDRRCPHLPPLDEDIRMIDFRDQILAAPKDIEDLAEAGRIADTCPYFGSRRAIPQAEVLTLPYNLLLQKSAREALGIDLKDQIVVIDEAHNLIPTLLSLSTIRLPFHLLETSLQQACNYISKFRTRLAATNLVHLKRLVVFLDALKKFMAQWKESKCNELLKTNGRIEKASVLTVAELLEQLGRKAAGINLLELEKYLKESKIARKISGYADKQAAKNNEIQSRQGQIPPLNIVEGFMVALTNMNDDGRLTLALVGSRGQEEVEIKYQLLNPAPNFVEIVDDARSVVLAGGTMSPISDVINQLFSHVSPERITFFSCGHIIPEESLRALVVTKSPRGNDLEFKADKQGDPNVVTELGQILLNFVNVVPAGMVVFFPSYNFLRFAKGAWQKVGALEKFSVKREVFFEPDESTDVERVLSDYAAAAKSPPPNKKGAILFAVIGAKLSEGLNFSDDLARAVIVIGLPFANLGSPELKERLKYVKRLEEQKGIRREKGQKDAAAELYENMCINAVNQSIGRAIRHKGDWASLILLDRRYASPAIRKKLPRWIGSRLFVSDGFGQTMKQLGQFYREKRS
ncbi:ATP-dependent RNA helicase chl1 [Leucoagaricus sp. SymC.cos]|nr:ATP-dependent RNA helicase chl1 [Leucoagaricus sp. SymC.cos]